MFIFDLASCPKFDAFFMNCLRFDAKSNRDFLNTAITNTYRIAEFDFCYSDHIHTLSQIEAPILSSIYLMLEFQHRKSIVKPVPNSPGKIKAMGIGELISVHIKSEIR